MTNYERKQEESRQAEYKQILDEDTAYEELQLLTRRIDNHKIDDEVETLFDYYDEIVIESMAKGLKKDSVKAEALFQRYTELIQELKETKDMFYKVMDV